MTPDRKFELMRQTFVAISRTYGESMRHIRDEAEASQVTPVVRAATPPSAQRASSASPGASPQRATPFQRRRQQATPEPHNTELMTLGDMCHVVMHRTRTT
jgi:hypothetical protein